MTKSNLYVKLDASYHDDEKILLAGEKAELLYLRVICTMASLRADGACQSDDARIPQLALDLAGRGWRRDEVERRAQRLIVVGLWVRATDGTTYLARELTQGHAGRQRTDHAARERARVTAEVRRRVIARDNWSCRVCSSTENLEVDHYIPVSLGGTSDDVNLWTLCRPCNSAKSNRDPEEWRAEVFA